MDDVNKKILPKGKKVTSSKRAVNPISKMDTIQEADESMH